MTIEAVLNGVKHYIIAQFEATRAALEVEIGLLPAEILLPTDSEYPTATTIPTPGYRSIATYDLLSPALPSIEILPSETDVDYGGGGQILDDGVENTYVTIRVTASGASVQTTSLILLRYREIIKRIVKTDPTFGGLFYRVRLGRANWMPMKATQESKKFAQEMYQDMVVWTGY